MEQSNSLKRLALIHSDPKMPVATQQTDFTEGRTPYPQIDPPLSRLKEYHRREVSINLSTERSVNFEPDSSAKKAILFPMPSKAEPKPLDLSIGDLSRKNTESVHSDNQNVYDGGDDYEQGEQVSMGTEQSEVKMVKFRKFQSHTQLPARMGHYQPETDAEIRMENRYLNTLNRNLRLKHEEEQLIDKMQDYSAHKARITRNSMSKIEAKKLFERNKRTDEYNMKYDCKKVRQNSDGGRTRSSVSLPKIASKRQSGVIDLSQNQPVDIVRTSEQPELVPSRKDDINKLKEELQTVLNLTGVSVNDSLLSTLLQNTLSSTKLYNQPEKKKVKKEDFEDGMRMMKVIEQNFRKKGITFDPKSLKKALLAYNAAGDNLSSFPSTSLISNPYYKRWGL